MPHPIPQKKLLWLALSVLAFCAAAAVWHGWAGRPRLARFPLAAARQDWAADTRWTISDLIFDIAVGAPQAGGGVALQDEGNFYMLDGAGRDVAASGLRTLLERNMPNMTPLPDGGFAALAGSGVVCIAPDGNVRWRDDLRDDAGFGLAPALDGELLVLGGSYTWLFDRTGRIRYVKPRAGEPWQLLDSAALDADALLLSCMRKDSGQCALRLETAAGQRRWSCELSQVRQVRLLPDGSAVAGWPGGLCRVGPDGRISWSVERENGGFDGRSFAVTSAGLIAVWWGCQLCFWQADGTAAAPPVWLGREPHSAAGNGQELFAGGDGAVYVQLTDPPYQYQDCRSNTILACSAAGRPLWRVELGHDNFSLLAVNAAGDLFGRRLGEVIDSGKWLTVRKAQIARLHISP